MIYYYAAFVTLLCIACMVQLHRQHSFKEKFKDISKLYLSQAAQIRNLEDIITRWADFDTRTKNGLLKRNKPKRKRKPKPKPQPQS